MSVFNHLGKLAKVEGDWLFYDYYPDYFSHAEAFGTFKVKSSSFAENEKAEYAFARRLGCREHGFSRPDEEVVLSYCLRLKQPLRVVAAHGRKGKGFTTMRSGLAA